MTHVTRTLPSDITVSTRVQDAPFLSKSLYMGLRQINVT